MSIEELPDAPIQIVVQDDRPLVSVPAVEVDGTVSVTYIVDNEDAEPMSAEDIDKLRSLAGVWRDISWDEMEAELHRIRHESIPTPPVES